MKKSLIGFLVFVSIFGFGTLGANAQSMDFGQLINLFIQLGVISPDKADAARAAVVNFGKAPSSNTFCHTWNSNLRIGDDNSDVDALQDALAKNGTLDASKVGFTEDVAAAVVKFQGKYGIPQTGYVGPLTRAKLNSLYQCNQGSAPVVTAAPLITSINPSSASTGDVSNNGIKATITGMGFLPTGNSVLFGKNSTSGRGHFIIDNLSSSDGKIIQFQVPLDILYGVSPVSVKNSNGTSNSVNFTVTPVATSTASYEDSFKVISATDNRFRIQVNSGDQMADLLTLEASAGGSSVSIQQVKIVFGESLLDDSRALWLKVFKEVYLVDDLGNIVAQADLNNGTVIKENERFVLTLKDFKYSIPAFSSRKFSIKADTYSSIDAAYGQTTYRLSVPLDGILTGYDRLDQLLGEGDISRYILVNGSI
ncbi:MAG: peptidoglycan-binding protein [Candidatus Paceibacterota bacterium]|jgi:peptidoglycan hydrolase-like protein with peptidoglycan-binding domain